MRDSQEGYQPSRSGYLSAVSSFLAKGATSHLERKLANTRAATAVDSDYFNMSGHKANNRPTALVPTPLPRARAEMSTTKAYKVLEHQAVTDSVFREVSKAQVVFKSLRPITPSQIQDKHLYLPIRNLVKMKSSGVVNSRLAVDGSRQPPDSYNGIDAGTSSTDRLLCLTSAVIADATHRRVPFQIVGCDIPAAFLHQDLTPEDTNGYQYITRLPANFPGELANQLNAIDKGHYGTKQGNNLFNKANHKLLVDAGYTNTILAPHIYRKTCPDNPKNYLFVNWHVDDGAILSTSRTLLAELKKLLIAKYGYSKEFPLTWNPEIGEYCGLQFERRKDTSVKVHFGKHIRSFLQKQGMDDIPGALTPACKDFFDPPSDTTPVDPIQFQSTQGGLGFYLPIRHDIKLFVNILSKQNHSPTQSDRNKQIHIMRYLKEYPDVGPVFSADPTCYPDGAQLQARSDIGFATLGNAQCTTGNLFDIGVNNASFSSYASAEPGIALSPQEGEYLGLGRCAKQVLFWQQFLEGLGFPQKLPTLIYEDNLPAINLVQAPEVTRNSRHVFVKHHFIRWLHQQGLILPVHQGTNDIKADFVTKVHLPRHFHYSKDVVFNAGGPLRRVLKAKHLSHL